MTKRWMLCFSFLALILFMILFSGCRRKEEKVILRFSDWHLTENVWNKSLMEAIKEFQNLYPDIKVILEPVTYEDKDFFYITESEAGMAPDIYHLHANSLQYFFSKGYAKNLDSFIKSEGGPEYLKTGMSCR